MWLLISMHGIRHSLCKTSWSQTLSSLSSIVFIFWSSGPFPQGEQPSSPGHIPMPYTCTHSHHLYPYPTSVPISSTWLIPNICTHSHHLYPYPTSVLISSTCTQTQNLYTFPSPGTITNTCTHTFIHTPYLYTYTVLVPILNTCTHLQHL